VLTLILNEVGEEYIKVVL